MTNQQNLILQPITIGQNILLRDRIPNDVKKYLCWQTVGEWREYDAPWEGVCTSLTQEQQDKFIHRFFEKCNEELPFPRQNATIASHKSEPLGYVNRYSQERFPDVWYVGIDICEDKHLNKGVGTEALRLWVNYLFSNSTIHKIALDTWSFNKRMIRVAEKLGFIHEGIERELILWQGQWLDMVHYGMLRQEWEEKIKTTSA
jgi:RimJ/RimL family protein N-acetyltransferase